MFFFEKEPKIIVLFFGAKKRTKRNIHLSPNLFPIWKRLN